jgi:hypothetical protein
MRVESSALTHDGTLLAVINRELTWVVGFAAREAHLAVCGGAAR